MIHHTAWLGGVVVDECVGRIVADSPHYQYITHGAGNEDDPEQHQPKAVRGKRQQEGHYAQHQQGHQGTHHISPLVHRHINVAVDTSAQQPEA